MFFSLSFLLFSYLIAGNQLLSIIQAIIEIKRILPSKLFLDPRKHRRFSSMNKQISKYTRRALSIKRYVNTLRDNCLHFAIIKTLHPGRRIDVYLNSRPFAVSNYEDVASLLTDYEKTNKEKRRKRLVKHFASILSLRGMCTDHEILTSGHHQTMKTRTVSQLSTVF